MHEWWRKPCSVAFRATRDSGSRDPLTIGWVVIHDAEAKSAYAVARYFASAAAGGSAHIVVDNSRCYMTLPDRLIPWGAPPLNKRGFHIEICGYAAYTSAEWRLENADALRAAAYKTATRCKHYGIPTRWVGPIGLRFRRKGVTTHADVSRAWKVSDHTDPGPNFPKDYFMSLVKQYRKEMR